jgi:hypothetical protein
LVTSDFTFGVARSNNSPKCAALSWWTMTTGLSLDCGE